MLQHQQLLDKLPDKIARQKQTEAIALPKSQATTNVQNHYLMNYWPQHPLHQDFLLNKDFRRNSQEDGEEEQRAEYLEKKY